MSLGAKVGGGTAGIGIGIDIGGGGDMCECRYIVAPSTFAAMKIEDERAAATVHGSTVTKRMCLSET